MNDDIVNADRQAPAGNSLSVKQKLILKEIERIENPHSGMVQKLLLLLFTGILFVQMEVITGSAEGIAVLVAVLLVHELGHFAAMKLTGYTNVRMFFIPFFGAAVSGREGKPGAFRKALVSLMGPLPGIVIGFACLYLFSRTGTGLFREYGTTSLAINILNLLPLYPLDGGQLFDAVVFSRRPGLEIFFKVLGALGLGLLAYASSSFFIGVFAVLVLFSIRSAAVTARVAKELRKEGFTAPVSEKVPESFVADVEERLSKISWLKSMNTRNLADLVLSIWNRVRLAPPRPGETAGSIALYVTVLFGSVILFFVMIWSMPLGDDLELKPFTPREGGFTVMMPGIPDHQKTEGHEPGTLKEIHTYINNHGRTAFAVHCYVLAGPPSEAGNREMLGALRDNSAFGLKGRVVEIRPVTLGDRKGEEYRIELPRGLLYFGRSFLDGSRAYQVFCVTPEANRESKTVRRFLDSFALTGAGK